MRFKYLNRTDSALLQFYPMSDGIQLLLFLRYTGIYLNFVVVADLLLLRLLRLIISILHKSHNGRTSDRTDEHVMHVN